MRAVSGLDPTTPGLDLQRACGTSLEAAILVGNKIALGQIDARHRRGRGYDQRSADRLSARLSAAAVAQLHGRTALARIKPLLGIRPKHFKPVMLGVVEARNRP